MGNTRNTKKRTTPLLTGDKRFKKWQDGECPYCGNQNVLKHVRDSVEGKNKGLHFSCGACKAENFFSNKRLIGAD